MSGGDCWDGCAREREAHPLLEEAAADFALLNDGSILEPASGGAEGGVRVFRILGEEDDGDGGSVMFTSRHPHSLANHEDEDCRKLTPSSLPSLGPTGNDVTKTSSNGAEGGDNDGDDGEDCLLGRYLVASFLPSVAASAREQVAPDPNQFHFSFLDDQDDCISVLTSRTFFTSNSVASEADYSEFCDVSERDSLCNDDLMTVLTPRTANYSCHASKISRSASANVSAYDDDDEEDRNLGEGRTANHSCHASKISPANVSAYDDHDEEDQNLGEEIPCDHFRESIKRSIDDSTNESVAFDIDSTHYPRGILRSHSRSRSPIRRTHPRGILRSHSRSLSPLRSSAQPASTLVSRTRALSSEGVDREAEIDSSFIRAKSSSAALGTDQDAQRGAGNQNNKSGEGNHIRTSSKNSVSFQCVTDAIGRTDVEVLASPSLQRAESNGVLRPRLNSESSSRPPRSPRLDARDADEDTLHTALAEPLASVVDCCGSTLTTSDERSLLIRQGRCPTCGIQTHKVSSGVFRRRRLRPLTNEHILSGRCLVCNPIDVVTRTGGTAESQAGDHQHGTSPVANDADQAADVAETEAKSNDTINHDLHPPRVIQPGDDKSKPNAPPPPPPSAPPLDVCSGSDAEPRDDHEDRKKYFSRSESRGEVERWLLSHLPTLQRQDVERYCHCLAEDGFDSTLMLEVLEEADLHFMKKAHRRYLVKRLPVPEKPRAHQDRLQDDLASLGDEVVEAAVTSETVARKTERTEDAKAKPRLESNILEQMEQIAYQKSHLLQVKIN